MSTAEMATLAFMGLGELVVVIVWLVRLEGRINYNEKAINLHSEEIQGLRVRHEALDSKIVEKLGEVEKSLARIEGRLEANKPNQ